MALLYSLRQANPGIFVTETHPTVLCYALRELKCKGVKAADRNKVLGKLLGVEVAAKDEHQGDAAISILPVVRWLQKEWRRDLHALPTGDDERLVHPCGRTVYAWPE